MATTVESRAARKEPSQMLDMTRRSWRVVGSGARGVSVSASESESESEVLGGEPLGVRWRSRVPLSVGLERRGEFSVGMVVGDMVGRAVEVV